MQMKYLDERQSAKNLVRCLVCGAVFPAGVSTCPVCGVGPDQFVPSSPVKDSFQLDTEEIFFILGGGVAAVRAAESIRERNRTASIVMVYEEDVLPYHRPMLTKVALRSSADRESFAQDLAIHDASWYEEQRIFLLPGKRVVSIDPTAQEVALEDGMKFHYDKCIYALGASCFVPPISGCEKQGTGVIRSLADVEYLRQTLQPGMQVVVIGGGVLGLEAAWELKLRGHTVTVIEGAPHIMGRQLEASVSARLEDLVRAQGILLYTGTSPKEIVGENTVHAVALADGQVIPADFVLFSCGVRANTAIAEACGLTIGRAIQVNCHMETSQKGIYACGDCAEFEGVNYAVWPEASDMGAIAGANAAGERLSYSSTAPAITFQGMGSALFAAGDAGTNPSMSYHCVEYEDQAKAVYEKYYFVEDVLVGGVLLGDLSGVGRLTEGIRKGVSEQEFGS